MRLARGQDITLGAVRYENVEPLAAGAVSDVYGAEVDGQRVVLKLLSDRWQPGSVESEGLQHEAEVLRILNAAENLIFARLEDVSERARRAAETRSSRVIVALLDAGLDENGRPYVVQQMAPPELKAEPVADLGDELRVLRAMQRVATAMALAHKHQFALKDFEPRTKGDRIRVAWSEDSTTPDVVCLIDWNITGGPEAFAQDLFYFGGHLYHLLLGVDLELGSDGLPPHTLGLGLSGWNSLSEGSRTILKRLLHRDSTRRYRTAAELEEDLTWLVRTIELALSADQADRLRERAYAALGQGRYDRLLAATELALKQPLPDETRQTFETLQDQARSELDKEMRQALAMINVSLLARQYNQAIVETERELGHLDGRSEVARRVRYLRLLAQVGQTLRTQGMQDPNQAREWKALDQGVRYLIQQAWESAGREFQRAAEMQPALAEMQPFRSLQHLAEAGQYLDRAAALRSQAKARIEDAHRSDWSAIERQHIAWLQEALKLLEDAIKLAPEEAFLDDLWQSCQSELDRRQAFLPFLENAEVALKEQRYLDALGALEAVLAQDPPNARALHLLPEAQRQSRFEEFFHKGLRLIERGDYSKALAALQAAEELMPGDEAVAGALARAEKGLISQQRLEQIAALWQDLRFDEAMDLVRATQALTDSPEEGQLRAWEIRLVELRKRTEGLQRRVDELRQHSVPGAGEFRSAIEAVLRGLRETMSRRDEGQELLPDTVRREGRALADASQSFLDLSGVPSSLPELTPPIWPPLAEARALLADKLAAYLAGQARASREVYDHDRVLRFLEWLSLLRARDGGEEAWLRDAEAALEGQKSTERLISDARRLLKALSVPTERVQGKLS